MKCEFSLSSNVDENMRKVNLHVRDAEVQEVPHIARALQVYVMPFEKSQPLVYGR